MCLHSRDSWAGAERWLRALALLGVDCDLTMTLASAPQLLGTQTVCVTAGRQSYIVLCLGTFLSLAGSCLWLP